MTPEGVADVLSEADAFLARIASLRAENSRPVALYVDASEADQVVRALALRCSEQEQRIAEQKRISEGFGRTIQILASNSGRIEEQLQEAEARCLELEAALRQAEQIAMSDDEVPERVMGLVWETLDARATLTPTVETERWHEGTMVEEGVTEPASSASGGRTRVEHHARVDWSTGEGFLARCSCGWMGQLTTDGTVAGEQAKWHEADATEEGGQG